MKNLTYEQSGVSIERGESLVDFIKQKNSKKYSSKVKHGVGGFASLYELSKDKFLVSGTDGVGTKLLLASDLEIFNTIGIDLVAMCVNDILCVGATPSYFLDYYATGKIDKKISEGIIEGIIEGCDQSCMPLIGGETAEMPGLYSNSHFDLAGFVVGEVSASEVIDGSEICENDIIYGLKSSGVHSNGFSLVRKLDLSIDEKKTLLTPTKIYVKEFFALKNKVKVKAMAHITGGGITNIARVNSQFNYKINSNNFPTNESFNILKSKLDIPKNEWFKTFNMGIGFCLISERLDENIVQEFNLYEIGQVTSGNGKVYLDNEVL